MLVRRALMQDTVVQEACEALGKLCEWYQYALLGAHFIVGFLVHCCLVDPGTAIHVGLRVFRWHDDDLEGVLE